MQDKAEINVKSIKSSNNEELINRFRKKFNKNNYNTVSEHKNYYSKNKIVFRMNDECEIVKNKDLIKN